MTEDRVTVCNKPHTTLGRAPDTAQRACGGQIWHNRPFDPIPMQLDGGRRVRATTHSPHIILTRTPDRTELAIRDWVRDVREARAVPMHGDRTARSRSAYEPHVALTATPNPEQDPESRVDDTGPGGALPFENEVPNRPHVARVTAPNAIQDSPGSRRDGDVDAGPRRRGPAGRGAEARRALVPPIASLARDELACAVHASVACNAVVVVPDVAHLVGCRLVLAEPANAALSECGAKAVAGAARIHSTVICRIAEVRRALIRHCTRLARDALAGRGDADIVCHTITGVAKVARPIGCGLGLADPANAALSRGPAIAVAKAAAG